MKIFMGYEIPIFISLLGLVVCLLGRFPNTFFWPLFVFFVCTPYAAQLSMNQYSGNAPFREYWIRFSAYGIILGFIAWAFVKFVINGKTHGAGQTDPDLAQDGFGDETISINNRYFVIAWNELENDKKHAGVWARALSASDGDSDKAKAIYIRLRVKELVTNAE